MWEQFLSRVKIIKRGRGPWVGPSEMKVVRETERKLKVKFPESYAAFATEVGPGVISRYYRIYVPTKEAQWCSLTTEVRRIRKAVAKDLIERKEEKLSASFFPFGNTVGGDTIGWDTRRVSGDGSEYPIYLIDRRSRQVYRVAETFPDFITNVCLGTRLTEFIKIQDYHVYKEFELFPVDEGALDKESAEEEDLSARFGEHLKRLREQSKFTLKEMADRAEIAPDQYDDIESGEAMPSFAQIEQIARVLSLPVYHLFQLDQ